MTPTQPQIVTTLMPIITFAAGILAGKNVFGLDALTWVTVLSSLIGAAAVIWSAVATRKVALIATMKNDPNALVTAAAELPQVQSIKLDPNAKGSADMGRNTPSNVA